MTVEQQLHALTALLSTRPEGELVTVFANLDHPDPLVLDECEDSDFYQWSFLLEVQLVTGEVRRNWAVGSHEDADLIDNMPREALCVPASALRSPLRVRVRGNLVFNAGPHIAWDLEITEGEAPLSIVDDAPMIDPIVPRRLEARTQAVSITSSDAVIVACLPEYGLVTRLRSLMSSRTQRYALYTLNGERALPELDAMINALPGHETGSRKYRGAPRGRLAIELSLNNCDRILVVEIFEGGVRQLATFDGTLTQAGFDATGSLLLMHIDDRVRIDANTDGFRRSPKVFDCDANQLVEWRDLSPDVRDRWEIPRTREASSTYVPLTFGAVGSWNPTSGVAVSAGSYGGVFPDALHCYHPSWGVRSLALPSEAGAVAVMRNGHVVVAGDRLLLVDPARSDIADLGPLEGYMGELQIIETENSATLWTHAPAHWRIDLPSL